ncbi:hypothetical protein E1286_39505 [Nonomuraea terrae]|uniref:Putative restriction endonuclease domain-containing protein n=1 Tax=Nonomuraea terrae TaxID=2530383 RepID=A0A4R4XWG7_9ACTN|nr:Uma2 family endonuclease [Nonomuraea terrae]TDD35474.1 hypothetical protein E1286_39505 [Nonomuraea terrae]
MATSEPTTRRTVLPGAPPFTVDDLLKFPDDGNRYELFNGSLVVSAAPTPLHQRAISRLLLILETAAPSGLECLTTVNVRPSDSDFYIPDLVVVSEEVSDSDEGPTLYVYELDGDSYKGPATHKAGTPATLTAPYPLSFDPACLAGPRITRS